MFLLMSCTSHEPWVSQLKKNVFSYAARIPKDSQSGNGLIGHVITCIDRALSDEGEFGIMWFLDQHSGLFLMTSVTL